MVEQIIFNSKIDFEIRMQFGEEKIALTKPLVTHRDIDRWVTNSVITSPVLGFLFFDNNDKKVFRIHEAAKFSNETLTRIENTINLNKGMEFVQSKPAEQILEAIQAQKEYRRLIIQICRNLKNDYLYPLNNLPC